MIISKATKVYIFSVHIVGMSFKMLIICLYSFQGSRQKCAINALLNSTCTDLDKSRLSLSTNLHKTSFSLTITDEASVGLIRNSFADAKVIVHLK